VPANPQTSTSHLLFYQLAPTSRPSYDFPSTSAFPAGGGAGEGDIVMGWELRSLGVAFVMGGCESVLLQAHALLITLRHPPSVLTAPYPLPQQLISPPGSHFPPTPLDGEGEEQVECEVWDLTKAREWMDWQGGLDAGIADNRCPADTQAAIRDKDSGAAGAVRRVDR
jgi:hypothetical protein